jgi:phosphoacetylglucosamine mutase
LIPDSLLSLLSTALFPGHTHAQACTKVINQAVGDALSDMLMALATLRVLQMDLPAWRDLYTDLPSKQVKVAVSGAKKATVVCSDDETRALAPAALQAALDGEMAKAPQGRCFVRPSGTEDCVRVYAEAATQDAADALAAAAVIAINTHLS